tara:strand:- start:328 stop:669 length:342 start_codon:yes stop_codon:yes gene_type:complete
MELELTKKSSQVARKKYKANLAHLESTLQNFDAVNRELEIGLYVSRKLDSELKERKMTLTPDESSMFVNLAMAEVVELFVEVKKNPSSSTRHVINAAEVVSNLLDSVKASLGN